VKGSILITGVYLSNQKNNIKNIVEELRKSSNWNITQKWNSIGGVNPDLPVGDVTVQNFEPGTPKFVVLNKLLSNEQVDSHDFIIISDDDIFLPSDFLDKYLSIVVKHDFAIAQPARTHNSYIDHHFVEQLSGLDARRTRYIENGPLFSVRRDVYPLIFPFNESTYMGWGYDFVWPLLIEKVNKRMGIVDATPVEHSMRKPATHYSYNKAKNTMEQYLSKTPHLSKGEAFRILESYS
jgi:hypothetical protein